MSVLKITDILNHLSNGVTRTKNSIAYNPQYGCLTEIYDVTAKEVDIWFQHPKLKGRKTKQPFKTKFTILDDVEETTSEGMDLDFKELTYREKDEE
jgi:hypothetical protein